MSVNCIGIDLGTTNSTVSYVYGESKKIRTVEGDGFSFPSTVRFLENGRIEPCVRMTECTNRCFALNSKRLIGRSFHSAFVANNANAFGCELREVEICPRKRLESSSHECGYYNPYSKKVVSATQVSSEILKYLKDKAEMEIGYSVNNAIITVPVIFTWEQRIETIRAAEMAGFKVVTTQPEPVMAVFDYCTTNSIENGVFAVYDFGGGTFDATIVSVKDKKYTTVQNDGDAMLGGENITQAMIKQIEDSYFSVYHKSLYEGVDEMEARAQLRVYVEKVKKGLQDINESISIDLQDVIPSQTSSISVTFDIPEVRALVNRTVRLMKRLIDGCGMKVDRILMIGGSSQFMLCKPMLKAVLSEAKVENYFPFRSVSRGAALCASIYPNGFRSVNGEVMFMNRLKYRLGYQNANGNPEFVFDVRDILPKERQERVMTSVDTDTINTIIIESTDSNVSRNCKTVSIKLKRVVTTKERLLITFFVITDLMLYLSVKDEKGELLAPYQRVNLFDSCVYSILKSLQKNDPKCVSALFEPSQRMPLLTRKRSSVKSTPPSVLSSPANTQKADVQETDYRSLLSLCHITLVNGWNSESSSL